MNFTHINLAYRSTDCCHDLQNSLFLTNFSYSFYLPAAKDGMSVLRCDGFAIRSFSEGWYDGMSVRRYDGLRVHGFEGSRVRTCNLRTYTPSCNSSSGHLHPHRLLLQYLFISRTAFVMCTGQIADTRKKFIYYFASRKSECLLKQLHPILK